LPEVRTYLVEANETETRLPDSASAGAHLRQLAVAETFEVWVKIDHGHRPRGFLGRLFGLSDRDIEPCFWLAKAGDVAALTFLDARWSEYRATDPAGPVEATVDQRRALSCGELTPASPEVCLRAERALEAAVEYLQTGARPSWLTYHSVP
jgi:hypothetical protein